MTKNKCIKLVLPVAVASAMLVQVVQSVGAAVPDADGVEVVTTEQELRFALSRDSSPKLTKDIKLTSCLVISGSSTILMEGKRLYRELSSSAGDGHVIEVKSGGDLTLKNSASDYAVITGGNAAQGGGILNSGTLKLENIRITGNKADKGGGVYSSGKLEMNNSELTNNSCEDGEGGNLWAESSASLTGVTVSGGDAEYGGGIFTKAAMTLKNVTVKENSSWEDGGGILNHGTLDLTDVKLTGNTSEVGGGGNLWSDDSATLSNVTITGGYARNGGGIANHGELVLKDCTVSDNEAAGSGGGVFFNSYTSGREMYLQGANTFTGNEAWGGCGGIMVSAESKGDIYIQDKPVIKDNKQYFGEAHNLYLAGDKKIHINDKLNKEANVVLSIESGKGVFTEDIEKSDVRDVFHGEKNEEVIEVKVLGNDGVEKNELHLGGYMSSLTVETGSDDGKTQKAKTFYYDMDSVWKAAFAAAEGSVSSVITLEGNAETPTSLTAERSGVTLDLNGYTLKRTGADKASDGEVITVKSYANFSIIDSSPKRRPEGRAKTEPKGGVITGGSSEYSGGCIIVKENGVLNINGCTLYKNYSGMSGGAVDVQGALNMNGTTVTENTAGDCGGGVCVEKGGSAVIKASTLTKNKASHGGAVENMGGVLTISSCTLTGNTVAGDGGAVEIRGDAKRTVIASTKMRTNQAGDRGGAIYVNSNQLFIADCEIQNNYAPAKRGGGIFVQKGRHISVQGRTIIFDNMEQTDSKPQVTNIALAYDSDKNQAFIQSAGLSEGSRIGLERVRTDGKDVASGDVLVVKNCTDYQKGYYVADSGSLSFTETGDKYEIYMATTVRPFGYAVYPLIGIELVAASAIIARAHITKKRRASVKNDSREGDGV